MPKIICKCKVSWSNGKQLPDGSWTGARAVLPVQTETTHGLDYEEAGIHKGGFEGWVNLPEVEKTRADYAEVYLWCPEETVKEMDAADNKDFEIMALLDDEAKALEGDLPSFLAVKEQI